MQTEKKFVFESMFQIQLLKQRIEKGQQLYRNMLKYEGDMLFLNLQSLEEVKKIIERPEVTIYAALNEEAVKVDENGIPEVKTHLYGLKVDPKKAIELIDAPIKEFISFVHGMDKEAINDFLSVAHETEQGIEISPELLEKKLERYRTYAVTPHQLEFLEQYQTLVQAVNRLIELGVPKEKFLHFSGKSFLIYSRKSHKMEINHQFYTIHS